MSQIRHGFHPIIMFMIIGIHFLGPDSIHARPASISFRHLTLEDGLPHTTVFSIAQDHQGFIYFGTLDGFSRYDGHQFRTYFHDPNDTTSISESDVGVLYTARDGTIWVLTWGGGVNHFDPHSGRFEHFTANPDDSTTLSGDRVQSILEDSSGDIWVGTFQNGLNRFDAKTRKFQRFQNHPEDPNSIGNNRIWAIIEDTAGFLWIGTDSGLNRYDPRTGTFTVFQKNPNDPHTLPHNRVRALYIDSQGEFWVGTELGLSRLDRENSSETHLKFIHYFQDIAGQPNDNSAAVNRIYEDSYGVLWVGTSFWGLGAYDPSQDNFIYFKHDPLNPKSLSNDDVRDIFEDHSGMMWIATRGGGVDYFDRKPPKFEHFQAHPNSPYQLASNQVSSILEDDRGHIWIGYIREGLDKFYPPTGEVINFNLDNSNPTGFPSLAVNAIFQDSKGELWFGTWGSGLVRQIIDPNTGQERFEAYRHQPGDETSLSDDIVFSIYEDASGSLLVGTRNNGLNRVIRTTDSDTGQENVTFVHYQHDPNDSTTLSNDVVYCIYDDRFANLWIGTTNGLNILDRVTQKCTRFMHDRNEPASISNNRIWTVMDTRDGELWVGTAGGLNHLLSLSDKSAKFERFTTRDGLPNNSVYGIYESPDGHLWMSTNNGLSCFDPQTRTFRNYDVSDGLQDNVFNQRAHFQSADGRLYFGGNNGFNRFFPHDVKNSDFIPPIHITGFSILGQKMNIDSLLANQATIELSYKQNYLTFEFVALDYTNPDKNRYQYKLDGLNDEWIFADKRRYANYTNLDGGEYTFRVRGTNSDGVWNNRGVDVNIQILPPFWKTAWAKAFYFLCGIGLIIGYVAVMNYRHRLRLRQKDRELATERRIADRLRQIDKLKDEFLANTSHEFRTPLNGIIGLTQSLIDGVGGVLSPKAINDLEMIARSAKRLAAHVDDILDFSRLKYRTIDLKIDTVDLPEVTAMIIALLSTLAESKKLTIFNHLPPDLPPVRADENRLQQILHNLIGNAIKFTVDGHIEISARAANDYVYITVADTGIGIPPDKLETVFESFEQVAGESRREFGGTGLGLTITKKLVELHGGTIRAESTPGLGSRFTFSLPVAEEIAEPRSALPVFSEGDDDFRQPPETALQPGAMSEFNILIVDDEPVNRQVLTNFLSMAECRVTQACDGDEARQLLDNGLLPDLILLDVMMPRISGYEVCEQIRAKYPVEEMPIILLTAKKQLADVVRGFESGASDYMTKPFSKHELLARVKSHLNLVRSSTALKKLKEKQETLLMATVIMTETPDALAAITVAVTYIVNAILPETEFVRAYITAPALQVEPGVQRYDFQKYQHRVERTPRPDALDTDVPTPLSIFGFSRRDRVIWTAVRHEDIQLAMLGIDYPTNQTTDNERMDFLGSLINSLSLVLSNLHHINEIQALNRDLEKQVEKRTQQLRQAQAQIVKLEKETTEKQMAGGFAHEMRNALAGANIALNMALGGTVDRQKSICLENSEYLQELFVRIKDYIPADQRKPLVKMFKAVNQNEEELEIILNKVRARVNQALIITREIMAYSRAGQSQAGDEPIQLSKVIETIVHELEPILIRNQIEVITHLETETPISGAETHFTTIIKNLVINAHDAMVESDKPEKKLTIELTRQGDDQVIRVIDTGVGISPENQKRVFEPFFSTKPQTGTGLGLGMVMKMVELYHGSIALESEVGQGTTFMVKLPINHAHKPEK